MTESSIGSAWESDGISQGRIISEFFPTTEKALKSFPHRAVEKFCVDFFASKSVWGFFGDCRVLWFSFLHICRLFEVFHRWVLKSVFCGFRTKKQAQKRAMNEKSRFCEPNFKKIRKTK